MCGRPRTVDRGRMREKGVSRANMSTYIDKHSQIAESTFYTQRSVTDHTLLSIASSAYQRNQSTVKPSATAAVNYAYLR